jgi:putative cofactor-binding repeat protein
VALYAEFGFEGALIASNLVDTAATGISVTNFNEGGRLAVVQGNLIRHLFRREQEPEDKRGHGITGYGRHRERD